MAHQGHTDHPGRPESINERAEGLKGIRHTTTRPTPGVSTGGLATVSNLRFDLANQVIYADLTGTKAAVGSSAVVDFNLPDTALWTVDSITGLTEIDTDALRFLDEQARIDAMAAAGFTHHNGSFSATTVLSGLKITEAGLNFFANSLGLVTTGNFVFAAVNQDAQGWGSISLTTTITPVPEPGAYALAGVGLLTVMGALRARRSTRA